MSVTAYYYYLLLYADDLVPLANDPWDLQDLHPLRVMWDTPNVGQQAHVPSAPRLLRSFLKHKDITSL